MIKRSQVQTEFRDTERGGCVVDAWFTAAGEVPHTKGTDVSETREKAKDACMDYVYGPILQKLNVLSGRLACEVGALSTPHLGGRVNEEINKVIAEIKTELEMR
jgi:hypothetical protein